MINLIADTAKTKEQKKLSASHLPYWIIFISGMMATIMLLIAGWALGVFSLGSKCEYNCTVNTEEKKEATNSEEATKSAETKNEEVTWKTYKNETLGFSLQIPDKSESNFGSCVWTEADGDHSYRPQVSLIPVKTFEDAGNNTAYLSTGYYYKLDGRTTENGHTYFSQCNKINNSLAELKSKNSEVDSWKIVGDDITNDVELTAFIKEQYGVGCTLGEKTETDQAGVFDVAINDGGADSLDEQIANDCVLNFIYVLKYYPDGNKVVTWGVGQSSKFFSEYPEKSYDDEIIDSFEFLVGGK